MDGCIETRFLILKHYINDYNYLLPLLSAKNVDQYKKTTLSHILSEGGYNNSEELIELMLLNNPIISDECLYNLLSIKDKNQNSLMMNYGGYLILNHFAKTNTNYLLKLLTEKDKTGNNLFYNIITSNNPKCLEFVLNSTILSKKTKIEMIWNTQNTYNGSILECQQLNILCFCGKNDKNEFKKLLSHEKIQKTLLEQCAYIHSSEDAMELITYFKQEKDSFFKALTNMSDDGKTCLMKAVENPNGGKFGLIKFLIESIMETNDYESQLKIFMIKDKKKFEDAYDEKLEDDENFIFKIKYKNDMKTIFNLLHNNIIEKLLYDTNKNGQTLQEKLRDSLLGGVNNKDKWNQNDYEIE
eukprot:453307_1